MLVMFNRILKIGLLVSFLLVLGVASVWGWMWIRGSKKLPECDAKQNNACMVDLEALEDVSDPYDNRQIASKGQCLRMAMWFFDPNQPDVGPARAALLSKFLRNPNCEKNLVSP